MFKILFFGIIPTWLALQKDWIWWLGYAVFVIVFFFLVNTVRNLSSALNIVMAKTTYSNLSEDEQLEVDRVAENILTVYQSDPEAEFENEFEQWGYAALAMHDLGIAPRIFFSDWFPVKNPSRIPPDKWIVMSIKTAKGWLESRHSKNGPEAAD
jgi:hypothetical protein